MGLMGLLGSLAIIGFPAMLRAIENPPLDNLVLQAVSEARLSAIRQGEVTELAYNSEASRFEYSSLGGGGEVAMPPGIREVRFSPTFGFGEEGPRSVVGNTGVLGFDRMVIETNEGEPTVLVFAPLTGRPIDDEEDR